MATFSITKTQGYFSTEEEVHHAINSLSYFSQIVKIQYGIVVDSVIVYEDVTNNIATVITFTKPLAFTQSQETEAQIAFNQIGVAKVPILPVLVHSHSPSSSLYITGLTKPTTEQLSRGQKHIWGSINTYQVTVKLFPVSNLKEGENFIIDLDLTFAKGGTLVIVAADEDTNTLFIADQFPAHFGIRGSGRYTVSITKGGGSYARITVIRTLFQRTYHLLEPSMYVKFNGVDSYIEVEESSLTGNLENILDLSEDWTISGVLREEDTSASSYIFNRWDTGYGINKYNGTNVFTHVENGTGGAVNFTAMQTENLIGKRFFFINSGTTLTCNVEGITVSTVTHGGVNDDTINGQLLIGARKHYAQITSPTDVGLDSLFMMNRAITSTEIAVVMNSTDFTMLSFYSDFSLYMKLGEDDFPDVVDTKRVVTEVITNAVKADFKVL